MNTPNKVRQVTRDAIRALAPSLKDVARQLGVSHAMARRYTTGDTAVPTRILRRLARILRQQATSLGRHAARIDREADRNP